MTSLSERVRALIDRHHGGVNAAAKAIGMPQPTLSRIADGTVQNPRLAALRRIATFYDVSVDWLLTGAGDAPRHEGHPRVIRIGPSPGFLALLDVMRELELSDDVQAAYIRAAWTVGVASRVLLHDDDTTAMMERVERLALDGIIEGQVTAWTSLLRASIQAVGVATARDRATRLAPFLEQLPASYHTFWSKGGIDIVQRTGIGTVGEDPGPLTAHHMLAKQYVDANPAARSRPRRGKR